MLIKRKFMGFIFLVMLFNGSTGIASDTTSMKMGSPKTMIQQMTQMHEKMAKMHTEMATCLKSGKSMKECRKKYMAPMCDKMEMEKGNKCPMMDSMQKMMEGMHKKGMKHKDHDM